MLSRAGWPVAEQFQSEKIVPSKSQNITDILTSFWFSWSFLNSSLKIPFNCDWNVWGYWIISENHACDHLRVRLRLITAPSDCNFQDFWTSFFEHRVIKWRRYTISVYHKMPNVIQWNVSLKQVTLEMCSLNIHLSPYGNDWFLKNDERLIV